jgi:predicted nucleotidyltransferase
MKLPENLPSEVQQHLSAFVAAAQVVWGDDLRAVVLYGSAAEGRLRATSDVNLLLVLRRFDRDQVNRIREPLRTARAAIRLGVMFLLEGEIAQAMTAFAVKFEDILRRRFVLCGDDPLSGREIPRAASVARLQQVLLNLRLRLRERYALVSLREEQLSAVAADVAGPLRACAATLLQLEGCPADNPKAALQSVVADMGEARFDEALQRISEAREQGRLAPGVAESLLFNLMDLIERLQSRVERLA